MKLEELKHYRFDGYWQECDENDAELPFSAFKIIDSNKSNENDYVEIPYTIHGDYCGCVSNMSNFRSIKKDYPECKELYGNFSSGCLIVKINDLINNEELQNVIQSLLDYPIYDESDESELQIELENEAWKSWLKNDFKKLLEEKLDLIIENEKYDLSAAFWQMQSQTNTYFIPENNSVYFPLDDMFDKLTDDQIKLILESFKNEKNN